MDKVISVKNDSNITFNVRLVERGDSLAFNNDLLHIDDMPFVEFYDSRFPAKDSEIGQFISRYYLDTLLTRYNNSSLLLQGGVPDWTIDVKGMEKVNEWLKEYQNTPSAPSKKLKF